MIVSEKHVEMIRQIKTAFADVKYPSNDKLVKDPTYWESLIVPRILKDKHWEDISPEEIFQLRFNLSQLTPEAFCCYLPAYLVGYLNNTYADLVDTIIINLGPRGHSEDELQEFTDKLNIFTPQQINVIKAFVKDFMETESYPSPENKIIWRFWEDYQIGSGHD